MDKKKQKNIGNGLASLEFEPKHYGSSVRASAHFMLCAQNMHVI